ncbi:MAG: PIN domain-containing protein [Prevotellaceae bacterium]|jgi:predicted nucleic acid-binding protein|nr:PIN domain-containing protein [Prevotellaceae bacterium]
MIKAALDTNVLIYCHDRADLRKRNIALDKLDNSPVIPTQVVSEYINVLKRTYTMPKLELLHLCLTNLEGCTIQPVDVSTLKLAEHIVRRYDLQIFDSIIVASSIEAGCKILYSEDMQHNMEVESQLKILNPFL